MPFEAVDRMVRKSTGKADENRAALGVDVSCVGSQGVNSLITVRDGERSIRVWLDRGKLVTIDETQRYFSPQVHYI